MAADSHDPNAEPIPDSGSHGLAGSSRPASGDPIDALIGRLYQAAIEPEAWAVFLDELARVVRADTMALLATDTAGRALHDLTFAVGTDQKADRDYRDYFFGLDPWAKAGVLEVPVGSVGPSEQFVPESELTRTEFYHDYYRPNGWHHGFGAKLFEDGEGMVGSVTGHRGRQAGPFGPEELQTLSRLVPHLRRALRVRGELEAAAAERDASEQLLERVSIGTLLVDGDGQIVFANRIAEGLLAARDGLSSGPHGLEAASSQQTAELRRAIAGAAETSQGRGHSAGGRFRVARPSGRQPYLVEVTPIQRGAALWGSSRSLAAVLVTDGNGSTQPDVDALRSFYRLTPAEAELAALLAQGMSLADAADVRGVSRNTARGQLKRIFSKTGTNRQAELVRLIVQGPAGFTHKP